MYFTSTTQQIQELHINQRHDRGRDVNVNPDWKNKA